MKVQRSSMAERDEIIGMPPPRENKGEKKPRWRLLLPALCLLVLLLAAGVFWWSSQSAMDKTTKYWFDKAAQSGTLTGTTPKDVQGVLDTIVEEGMFNVSVNSQVVFENSREPGSLGLENISANRYYCRVILVRNDNGETIYKSKGIKPGQYLDEITLSKNLEAGTYPCTARVIATDPETLDDVGQVDVQVEVVVLNES